MSNRIVKDFMDWNLITEITDMVVAPPSVTSAVAAGGGTPGSSIPTGGVAPKEPKGTSGTSGSGNRSRAVASNVSAGTDGTAATGAAQLVPAAVDKLSKEIAEMIVALFAKTRAFWAGENDLKLKATGWNDTEADGDKIFKDYWTKYILPKINMIPAGNKNKITLTDLQALISKSILAGGAKNFTFQIVTTSTGRPVAKSYTINTDY